MSRQAIGIGAAANDGTGDPLRTAFTKANDNFSEIYSLLGGDTLTIAGARTALGLGTGDSPTFAGVTLGALSTIHFTGLTANALLLSDGTDLTQSANLTYTAAAGLLVNPSIQYPLKIAGTGSTLDRLRFSTLAAGSGAGIDATNSAENAYAFLALRGSIIHLKPQDGNGLYLTTTSVESQLRFVVTAGTATTDVAALSITRTNNHADVGATVPWVSWDFTDTISNAGALAFRIRGGAAAATQLFAITKGGTVQVIDGSTGAPGISWAAAPNTGIHRSGNSLLFSMGASNDVLLKTGIGPITRSDFVFGWATSTDATGTVTSGLSQISAGLIGVGTGAAGSFAGRLKLTSAIAAGVAIGSLNASPTVGEVQSVTDALAPALGATVAAGGAAKALVWYNGANWTVIGV